MGLESIPSGVLAAIGAAAFGGLVGGAMTAARRNLLVSMLIGAIVGLSVATVCRLLNVPPLLDVEGYSLLWSFLGGLGSSYLISSSTV
jgi:hypothetical protein